MTLLSPLSLLWLASLPVFLWLWRLASTHRQIRVPSLVPFEHLLRRQSRRRTRLVINRLFWLQLAALLGLVFTLTQPILWRPRTRTILAVLDTSASMTARAHGRSRIFDRAKQQLQQQLERSAQGARVFLMTTAPVAPVLPQPTADVAALLQALQTVEPSHLGGNLATTVRVGRSLLGEEPDAIFIATDEVPPEDGPGERVDWITVGEPQPNVAIVGVDAQGALCDAAEPRVLVTVQGFTREPAAIELIAAQQGRELARAGATIAPRARASMALPLPAGTAGDVEIQLRGSDDALDVDNRAWLHWRPSATLPVVVQTADAAFAGTISRWMRACPSLSASTTPPTSGAYLLVTDDAASVSPSGPAALMLFHRPVPSSAAVPTVSHWLVSSDHPVGAYLPPLDVVAAQLDRSAVLTGSGVVVISALIQGRKLPVLVAEERDGRRVVQAFFDPVGSQTSTPVTLAFFNSLRWLMGSTGPSTVGEPLVSRAFAAGPVRVRRPDGQVDTVEATHGWLRYDGTLLAGRYALSQGAIALTVGVSFINPLESNLLDRVSTWQPVRESMPAAAATRAAQPLATSLLWVLILVLFVEWRLYSAKHQSVVRSP